MEFRTLGVRKLVNVNIAILAVLASVLTGLGAANVAIPLAAVAAAALSLWLTDFTGRFSIGRWTVNVAVASIAVITVWRFTGSPHIADLPILAEAFAFLQIVLLFEKKTARTWWDLLSLGFVQVVFAALQELGPLFGLVLVAYLFFGLSAVSLMFLYRERASVSASPESARTRTAQWVRLSKVIAGTLVVGPLSLFLRFRERSQGGTVQRQPARTAPAFNRWPLSQETAALHRSDGTTARPPDINREFWYRIVHMAVICVALALIVFFTAPRFGGIDLSVLRYGSAGWAGGGEAIGRTIGFSNRVKLGELGTLLDDQQKVLEIEFLDHATGESYTVPSSVYLRGALLTHYGDGQWEHRESESPQRPHRLPSVEGSDVGDLVRQRIAIEPMRRGDLFCVWPLVFIRENENVGYNAQLERLERSRRARSRRFICELGTTAFSDGVQADLMPCEVDVPPFLQRWPPRRLPKLAALAEQWVSESGIASDDPIGRARHLEACLSTSDRFSYRLEETARDAAIDPVEDFVANNPEGNCEFFATALTLMLRSQGTPARMVVGFKSSESGYFGESRIARQSHAHTWVEAFIPADRLVQTPRPDGPLTDWSRGAWLRLDPTPAASAASSSSGLLAGGLGYWIERLSLVWRDQVMGMSGVRQRESIYGPLATRARRIGSRMASLDWWSGVAVRSVATIGALPEIVTSRVGWQGGLACLAMLVVATVALGEFRRLSRRRRLNATIGANSASRNGQRQIKFYRRLETLLVRHGLVRAASQTHREFARDSGIRLSESTDDFEIAALPLEVVDAFYQVRFGDADLSENQMAAVQHALHRIKRAANGKRRKRSRHRYD